ncbi:MAG TPA: cobalt-precorrin-6A reductase [Oscillatoriaceae cyanobacterium M33_DOE_052]|uniref:Cobalt-precorrin-6A reductase n=1 Tax=Planktothricoides sp. SpSt-374 TaxID=2282167 RepID=A0A7C3VHU5_9CYAN|nr:cobalt-precorrin-6A reductase [Oscillatoriaceae cyanobacterium M33_DOE_052]
MVKRKRLLILGGTGEAADLAAKAGTISGVEVITSLAGRTRQAAISSTPGRIGGFGGVAGLREYLQEQEIDYLIDATHPFAAQISGNAAQAADDCNIPRLMLLRPAWEMIPGDNWIEVKSNEAAARVLPSLARRIFLTIGRQELANYAHLKNLWFLMRMIEPPLPDTPVPPGKLLLEKGAFSLESERSLLGEYDIGAIVSKNSGGDATYGKIIAARELGLPVVMVQRPLMPNGEKVTDVETALSWLKNRLLV